MLLVPRKLPALQPLLLVEILEGLDDVLHVARHDRVELVKRQIDAMIGRAILRVIIGADALAAVARADEGAAFFGALIMERLLLALVKPAAQDTHGAIVVLVLAPFVLTFDFHLLGRAALV